MNLYMCKYSGSRKNRIHNENIVVDLAYLVILKQNIFECASMGVFEGP